jgi:hypothetical protein
LSQASAALDRFIGRFALQPDLKYWLRDMAPSPPIIPSSILIIGSGVFGLSTADSLCQRPEYADTKIVLIDRLPFPAPDSASVCIRILLIPLQSFRTSVSSVMLPQDHGHEQKYALSAPHYCSHDKLIFGQQIDTSRIIRAGKTLSK